MEARTITIISTKSQNGAVTLETSATTLGELKSALRENSIDYAGMTFYEGLTKSELKSDDSLLPTNVPYKGTTTNNLVFMLTFPKKIKSGMYSRAEAYKIIQDNNGQDSFRQITGKSYTNSSTDILNAFIEDHLICKDNCCGDIAPEESYEHKGTVVDAIIYLVDVLKEYKVLSTVDVDTISNRLVKKSSTSYIPEEFKQMFSFLEY